MNELAFVVRGEGVSEVASSLMETDGWHHAIIRSSIIDDDTLAFTSGVSGNRQMGILKELAGAIDNGIMVEYADDGWQGLIGIMELDPCGNVIYDMNSTGVPGNTKLYNRVWRANGHEPNDYL